VKQLELNFDVWKQLNEFFRAFHLGSDGMRFFVHFAIEVYVLCFLSGNSPGYTWKMYRKYSKKKNSSIYHRVIIIII